MPLLASKVCCSAGHRHMVPAVPCSCCVQQPLLLMRVGALACVGIITLWFTAPGATEVFARNTRPRTTRTWEPHRPPKAARIRPPTAKELAIESYRTTLKQLAEDGDWERASQVMNDMRSEGLKDDRSMVHALEASGKARRWQEASDILEAMKKDRLAPDHRAYHAALEACDGQGVPEFAISLMQQMQQRGLPMNAISYAQVLKTLVQAGDQKRASKMYQEASDQGLFRIWTGSTILDVREYPIEVAEIIVRFAVEERANAVASAKAGKGGFRVITGPSNKREAYKQRAVIKVLEEEYGLKVRVDPAKLGKVSVRFEELKRLGGEMQPIDAYPIS